MGRHLGGLDVDLQRAIALTRDRHRDHTMGDVHSLEFRLLAEPDEPRLTLLDHIERLADEHRLSAGAADPSVDGAVRGDDRPGAVLARRGRLAPHDGRQGERLPGLHQLERLSHDAPAVGTVDHGASVLTGGMPLTSFPVLTA